jgi:hypothetical protein
MIEKVPNLVTVPGVHHFFLHLEEHVKEGQGEKYS